MINKLRRAKQISKSFLKLRITVNPIFLNSIPKSGTNLVKNVLLGIPDLTLIPGLRHLPRCKDNDKRLNKLKSTTSFLRRGQLYVGHLEYFDKAHKFLQKKKFKIIFLIRDPRAICVSSYYYSLNVLDEKLNNWVKGFGDKDEALLAYIKGVGKGKESYCLEIGKSLPNINSIFHSYLNWCQQENVLVLKYEDFILGDKINFVQKILKFLFDDFPQEYIKLCLDGADPQKSSTFRSGTTDSWRDDFKDVHYEAFREVSGNLVERLGYKW